MLRGCVPKKLLVYGSDFASAFADAPGFGWTVPEATHDWAALIEAKDKELDRLHQIYVNMLKNAKVEIIDGRGVVVDPQFQGRGSTARPTQPKTSSSRSASWPETPKIPGIEHVITSNEALDLKERPKRIVIVGGGYIAVEFAGIFNGFGQRGDRNHPPARIAARVRRGFARPSRRRDAHPRSVDIHRGNTQIEKSASRRPPRGIPSPPRRAPRSRPIA